MNDTGIGQLLSRLWTGFRTLPMWAQVIAWVVGWPLLLALMIVATRPLVPARAAAAGAVLLVGGFVWSGVLTGGGADPSDSEPAVAAEADDEAQDDEKDLDQDSEEDVDEADDEEEADDEGAANEAADADDDEPDLDEEAPDDSDEADEEQADADEVSTTEDASRNTWTVTNIVDGDTIDVRQGGTEERVRVVGIDTPERGECGFNRASQALADRILGEDVTLTTTAGGDDRDHYDRILRYIDHEDTDAGLELIKAGLSISRYDSRDGYGRHPRQAEYIAADDATEHICDVETPTPAPAPDPKPEPKPDPKPEPEPESDSAPSNPWGSSSCDPAYDPCVPPKSEVGDLNCPDIKAKYSGGVSVDHSHGDGHGLDGDKDGRGCE